MKTVVSGKIIRRVSDSEAIRLIKSGRWEYAPKHLWKDGVRDAGKPQKKAG